MIFVTIHGLAGCLTSLQRVPPTQTRGTSGFVDVGHTSTLSNVPRDPEVRGFVRLEQQHRDTHKEPDTSGTTSFFLLSGNVFHVSARTRQDSLKLAFWGSRGTTKVRSASTRPKAHLGTDHAGVARRGIPKAHRLGTDHAGVARRGIPKAHRHRPAHLGTPACRTRPGLPTNADPSPKWRSAGPSQRWDVPPHRHGTVAKQTTGPEAKTSGCTGTVNAAACPRCLGTDLTGIARRKFPKAHRDRPAHLRAPAYKPLSGSPRRAQSTPNMAGAGPSLERAE